MDLVDFLQARGRLDAVHCERVRALKRERGESEALIITRLGMVGEREMAEHLAEFLGIPVAAAGDYPAAPVLSHSLKPDFLARARALPLADEPQGIVLAMADPTDDYTIKAVRLAAGRPVMIRAAVPGELAAAIDRLYGAADGAGHTGAAPAAAASDVKRLADLASEEPVIRYVNRLVAQAASARASDIHIESSHDRVVLRLRVDGLLRDIEPPPAGLHDRIVSRIKITAGLNIAERRLPQDGRFRMAIEGREIDLRVSIVPTLHGESVVMRLLDRERAPLDLAELGFSAELRHALERLVALPSGMLLVTGPTGSGKTSTLYAALQLLNKRERKILTVEDPVEYQLPGINQIPVRPAIGLTFASLLRALLRQDPDVLLVGEIRDLETAKIAAQASLTGHLLLSTVHTNDAVSTIVRLLDMGLEDYLLASVLKGVVAQRLVRTLCRACRAPWEPPRDLWERSGLGGLAPAGTALYRAAGCAACGGTGYRGRTAIAEFLAIDERIYPLILARADAQTVAREAAAAGMADLRTDGLTKALAGMTSLEEVLRVTGAA
ncbi:MAG TPA: GspE/PulE family protein [Stellaceae bacterium]|nr:GspE/PulE family protein [Stellaceae bacterium]